MKGKLIKTILTDDLRYQRFNVLLVSPPQVRLMLVLAPVMCILSGIGVSQVLTTYMKNLDVSRPDKKSKKQQDSTYPIKNEVRG